MISWRGDCDCRVASQTTPVYTYDFADPTAPSYLKPTTFPHGTAHTYELPYLFLGYHGGTVSLPVALTPAREALRRDGALLEQGSRGIPVGGMAVL